MKCSTASVSFELEASLKCTFRNACNSQPGFKKRRTSRFSVVCRFRSNVGLGELHGSRAHHAYTGLLR